MENIKDPFLPHEESLELKKLGFNEKTFAQFNTITLKPDGGSEWLISFNAYGGGQFDGDSGACIAPTFSQAFDFFEKEYGIYYSVWPEFYHDGINFNWQCLWYLPIEERTKHVISGGTMQYGDTGEYPTRRLAHIAVVRKMIEIVKKRNLLEKNRAIVKLNGGRGALLCSECRTIIKQIEDFTSQEMLDYSNNELVAQYCEKCKVKKDEKHTHNTD